LRAPESERDRYEHLFHVRSHFVPVERDDVSLLNQATKIAQTLEAERFPELSPKCPECKRESLGAESILK
jgi:hypothetical protein